MAIIERIVAFFMKVKRAEEKAAGQKMGRVVRTAMADLNPDSG